MSIPQTEGQIRIESKLRYGYNFLVSNVEFHMQSDHTVDDERYDLEMQIIHRTADSETNDSGYDNVILSIFFDAEKSDKAVQGEDNTNDFLDSLNFPEFDKH